MKHTKSYNIHNILKIGMNRDREDSLRDLINLKFSFFEDENVDGSDITLNIGKFVPSNRSCYHIDHKYYIKDNYLFCKDSGGGAKWNVEISGFEDGETIINFDGSIKGVQSLINPDFIAQNLLLRLIEYKLCRNGYFFAHSAGVSKDGHAYIFAGRGGTFKTSICMDFVRREGFDLLGDDRVILHRDKALSFPMGLRLFDFMCENLSDENSWSFAKKAKFIKYLWDTRTSNNNSTNISKPARLKSLLLIAKTNDKEITVRDVSLNEAIHKLVINNRLEDFISLGGMGINSGPHLKYTLAYAYIFPDSKITKFNKKSETVLRDILGNMPLYEIKIPSDYSSANFNKIYELVAGNGV